jgi:hypothetical protein
MADPAGSAERDGNIRTAGPQPCRNAGQRTPGADRTNEPVDAAHRAVPDLRRGRLLVSASVGDVVELVCPERPVRLALGEILSQAS